LMPRSGTPTVDALTYAQGRSRGCAVGCQPSLRISLYVS
jgi:hypothetical protein